MTNDFEQEIHAVRQALSHLCALGSTEEISAELGKIYSRYGHVRGISALNAPQRADVYLIDFHHEDHAISAANLTGFHMFGFNTVIVDLRRLLAV